MVSSCPAMTSLNCLPSCTAISSLPFTINECGSYFLTGCLTGGAGNGITIDADDVTLDLNGFALIGGVGSLDGVKVMGFQENIEIKNGSLRGWGQHGVDADFATNSVLAELRASDCVSVGFRIGNRSRVSRCTAQNCVIAFLLGSNCIVNDCGAFGSAGQGILTGVGCTVRDCAAEASGLSGIEVNVGSTVQNCTARQNAQSGIKTGLGATVLGCAASQNDNDGFQLGSKSRMVDCNAYLNGDDGIALGSNSSVRQCTATTNGNDGIFAASECTVAYNDCTDNGTGGVGAGVRTSGFGIRVESNNINSNQTGLQGSTANCYFADNTVQANTDNYDFAFGNQLNLLICEIPESIDWPASIKLAGTLVGETGENGLAVNSGDVTIDMAGHALIGVPGSLNGIVSGDDLAVYNGVLRGWGSDGITAFGESILVHDVRTAENGDDGMSYGVHSIIVNCIARNNLGDGLTGFGNSVIAQCTNTGNTADEFGGNRSLVTQCYTETINLIDGLVHATSYSSLPNITTTTVDSLER